MANTYAKNRLSQLAPAPLTGVDNLLEHFFGPVHSPRLARSAPASLWEADQRLHLEIDAPGVQRDGVDVTYDKGTLTVTLERNDVEDRSYLHNERGFGKVTRTVALPETVDPESIEAELQDGVLRLSIAKRPEALPKKIELK